MTTALAIFSIASAVAGVSLIAYRFGQLSVEERIMHGGDPHIDALVDLYADDARRRSEKRMRIES